MGRKVAEHVIELPDSYEGSTDSEELGRGFGILWRAGGLEGGSVYYHVSRIKGGKWVVHRGFGLYLLCISYLLVNINCYFFFLLFCLFINPSTFAIFQFF